MIHQLTERLPQIIGDNLLLIVLLTSATANLLGIFGHEQLLDFVQDASLAELDVFLLPGLCCWRVCSPVRGGCLVHLVPMESLELLLRPHNRKAKTV